MSTIPSNAPLYLLDAATAIVGSLLIYSGVLGTFLDPVRLAIAFGIPSPPPPQTLTFLPSGCGRNLAAGIFVWTLTILRERKVLGIFLLCWTMAGISDVKILLEYPGGRNVGVHVRNICILVGLGLLNLRYEVR
ncbi:DUF4267 domain-containing protein [Aspergillus stella-maris]|uniref:DUF4267 domain-containing protein n=1 Tax=Aspergillus stella-maris TaxID=1810926 RepID=UPI003CCD3E42